MYCLQLFTVLDVIMYSYCRFLSQIFFLNELFELFSISQNINEKKPSDSEAPIHEREVLRYSAGKPTSLVQT